MIKCIVNDKVVETTLHPGNVTLDLLRNELGLKGTKEGCREGECGACTVLVGELLENGEVKYKACASCILPIGEIEKKHIVTVEGLNLEQLTPVQKSIFENNASQCGFCTPGIILSLTGFLLISEKFSYEDAVTALDGNICRCTGYVAIKKAAKALSEMFNSKKMSHISRVEQLIKWKAIPKYFKEIPVRLKELSEYCRFSGQNTAAPVLVGGGTDLFVQKPDELSKTDLKFISSIESEELKQIKIDSENIYIGGAVTVEELRKSEIINKYFKNLETILLLVSSTIMRNKATVAGNIVNASPIGGLSIIMLALDASLYLRKNNNLRIVKLKDFFKGYKDIDLMEGEVIYRIAFPVPDENTLFSFEKVSNRKHLDIAACNSAVSLKYEDGVIKEILFSAGGVAPIPLLLTNVCDFLKDKKVTVEVLKEAGKLIIEEVKPIDDIRGTAEYKKLLLRQLFFAHFIKLFPEDLSLQEVVK